MLKRLLFLIGVTAAAAGTADAQTTTTTRPNGLSNTNETQNPSLTPQALFAAIGDLQKRVNTLEQSNAAMAKQLALLNGHTHGYSVPPSPMTGLFNIDDIKNYILHNQGSFGGYLVLVRNGSYTPQAPPPVQTSAPVAHSSG